MPQQKCGQLTIFRFRQQRWKCAAVFLVCFFRKTSRFVFIHKQKWTTQTYRDKHSQERVTSHWASTGLKTTPPSSDRSPSARLTDIKMIFICATRGGVRNITFSCYNHISVYLYIYRRRWRNSFLMLQYHCAHFTVSVFLLIQTFMYVAYVCVLAMHSFKTFVQILSIYSYIK